ncbi:phosphoribosylglycinamide formyltransferase [Pelagibacterales bacterium SAG-MED11]|nr:phosphoribosylglycinamide formyltransferase [Pelagibacterales bacterium SAG-MED11]
MVKLIGSNKIKTAVFISGTGSNLKNLIQFSFLNKSPIKISLIVSSNKRAKGLNFADRYKIKKKIYDFNNIKKSESLILKQLKINKISLICLAGFMKILSPNFIKKFKGIILNIHPSLLPKYKGLNTHERVLQNKEKYSGCTVHYVNSRLDSGKIILQAKVKISKKDTSSSLKKKIIKQEHLLYRKAIRKVFFSL